MCVEGGGGGGGNFKSHNSENDTAESEASMAYDLPSESRHFCHITSNQIPKSCQIWNPVCKQCLIPYFSQLFVSFRSVEQDYVRAGEDYSNEK